MTDHPCSSACRHCRPGRPCPSMVRWLEAEREELSKAHGLDLIARRSRARRALLPRRYAPITRDRFGASYEIDPAKADR